MAFGQPRIEYKTNAQMRIMHEAGLVLTRALDAAEAAAAPGVTTKQLDEAFAAVLDEAGRHVRTAVHASTGPGVRTRARIG